jgi:beta-glucanase (GH16 family)
MESPQGSTDGDNMNDNMQRRLCHYTSALSLIFLMACGGGDEVTASQTTKDSGSTERANAISSTQTYPPSGYSLAFSDEFSGTSVDTSKWNLRTDVKLDSAQRSQNVVVSGGIAVIQLKKESFSGKSYTGGGLISKQGFRYGYFEARAQMHGGSGWHQSVWAMRGDGTSTFNSDRRTEIDASEFDSNNHTQTHMGVLRWQANGSVSPLNCPTRKTDLGFDASAGYHAYGYEWTETQVKFYVDGQLKCTVNFPATNNQHDRINLWLTAIAASQAAGTINDATLPGEMRIGHAAFYEKDHYIDNSDSGYNGYNESGTWLDSTLNGYANSSTRYALSGDAAASWRPNILAADTYKVSYYNIQYPNNHTAAKFEIVANGTTYVVTKNLATASTGWIDLGNYYFASGSNGYLRISRNNGSVGTIRGDMVKFVRQ